MTVDRDSAHLNSISLVEASGIATLILNRPERANAMTVEMMGYIASTLTRLEAQSTPVCVLRGAGGVFSVGRDSSERVDPKTRVSAIVDVYQAVDRFTGLFVVAAQGTSRGLASALCALADVCVSDHRARFAFDELQHGLPPFLVMTYLRGVLPEKVLQRLVLTGSEISADEALVAGLVTEICSEAELESRLESVARSGTSNGELLRRSKQFLRETRGMPRSEIQDLARRRMVKY